MVGGSTNSAFGSQSVIVGGFGNFASGTGSFIGGGGGEYPEEGTEGEGGHEGPLGNAAFGDYSFIGGGFQNMVDSTGGAVGGGVKNTVSTGSLFAFIGAGQNNSVRDMVGPIAAND